MSSGKSNLKLITQLVYSANSMKERFDKYQEQKGLSSDNFVKYMSKSSKDIITDLAEFQLVIKRAIQSIDIGNNKRFAIACNNFIDYLLKRDINEEFFEDKKKKLMAIFREEYAGDTSEFGGVFLEESKSVFKFLSAMVGFLDTKKKESDELENEE